MVPSHDCNKGDPDIVMGRLGSCRGLFLVVEMTSTDVKSSPLKPPLITIPDFTEIVWQCNSKNDFVKRVNTYTGFQDML